MSSGTAASTLEPSASQAPVPVEGIEFLGRYDGSGFRHPRYLLRRSDGQVAQLPWLLYRTAWHLDGRRSLAELAALLGADTGRDITASQVGFLIAHRLRPAGLAGAAPTTEPPDQPPGRAPGETGTVAAADTTGLDHTQPPRGDHLLMLRLRTALVPDAAVWRVAGPLRPLFRAPVVVLALAAFVAVDVAVVAVHGWAGVVAAGQQLTTAPALTLAVLGVIVAGGVFHECGHVTACRYGGATPGPMGVGIYLVWPAFYSTVTDAYRLDRGGRLRTDLGGVYFNTIFLTILGGGYLATGQAWLLAALVVWHVETVWQFLPSLRLDGYYILADLVGVPDLFNRMRPILRSLFRREHADPLVADLKPWVRRVVTAWVVLVVPFLLYWVVLFAVLAPQLAPAAWQSLTDFGGQALEAARSGQPAAAVVGVLGALLLVLPWAAGSYLVATLLGRLARAVRGWLTRRRRGAAAPTPIARARLAPRTARSGLAAGCLLVFGAGLAGAAALGPPDRSPSASPAVPAAATAPGGAGVLAGISGPPTLYGQVTAVRDPDTAVVEVAGRPITVDVIGADAAAIPVCALDAATAFARDTLLDQAVTLVPDPTLAPPPPDSPTWPAYLVLDDQQSYTDTAITAGWAGAGQGRYRPGFLAEQQQARDTGAGMWGLPCAGPPP
ncbi:thermonuclease family protein [Pseudonocardia nantongensis]|uniref:thermonuclease family protein n=1 Tax=Pseudonocardia nantongensis TaxID=1181885 RepID=UPI00397C159B